MIRAGKFSFPGAGELILVRPGAEPFRASGYAFDVRPSRESDNATHSMLRELIAIRRDGGRKS